VTDWEKEFGYTSRLIYCRWKKGLPVEMLFIKPNKNLKYDKK
jgi:hypothetical protein